MYGIKALIATSIVVLVAVACGGATDAQPPVRTTVTIAVDSVWQVPSGFSVVLPLTNEGVGEMLRNDPGAPPDLPEFSMSGEVQADGEPERCLGMTRALLQTCQNSACQAKCKPMGSRRE